MHPQAKTSDTCVSEVFNSLFVTVIFGNFKRLYINNLQKRLHFLKIALKFGSTHNGLWEFLESAYYQTFVKCINVSHLKNFENLTRFANLLENVVSETIFFTETSLRM